MKDTDQLETLTALADAKRDRKSQSLASVRVSPGPYLAVASVLTFLAALLLRSNREGWALVLICIAWLIVPALAFTDRIVFDGGSIRRQGPISALMGLIYGYRKHLNVSDFELLETHAVRTLRRGGSVRYRYRTQIIGKGKEFVIASGGHGYRKLVRELLPLIHQDKLDNRTRDLRDYLNDPAAVSNKAKLSMLASEDVLDSTSADRGLHRKQQLQPAVVEAHDLERAHLLRRLGNELRVMGRLKEAAEAFRRALNVTPRASWLLYDLARLLRSQASAQGDARLLSRARAALRLARIRANGDVVLLPLIGESFLECGDTRQARRVLQEAVDLDYGNYKARLGLADLSLREGKLAHVIHHYHEAARVTSESALARYARREADYYTLLNDDEDYLVTELRRISWLQNVTRVRRMAGRVTSVAILTAIIGGLLDPLAGSIGWSMASSALILWLLSIVATRLLFSRSKPESFV
jgi:tetratricopeptide (TPR) repeat protein